MNSNSRMDIWGECFSNYASDWYEIYKKPFISDLTRSMYKSASKTANQYIGEKDITEIKSRDIQFIINDLYQKGFSKSKIDKVILFLRQVFNYAHAEGDIEKNPTATVRKPKMVESHKRALSQCEEKVITDCCKTSKYGTWILSMLYLGLRPSETALIQKKDIANGYIHIRGTKTPKADRYIPLPKALTFDLSEKKDEDYIFVTEGGNPLTRQSIKRWWKFFKRDLDLYMNAPTYRNKIIESYIPGDITLYTFRHTFGTKAQKFGIPIDIIADFMGHEKIETTRRYYISDNFQSKERQRSTLDAMTGSPEVMGSSPICSTKKDKE